MIRTLREVLRETLILLVAGFALALLANQLSPRGLSLRRNYFPKSNTSNQKINSQTNIATTSPELAKPTSPPGTISVEARLREKGLNVVTGKEAEQLSQDPQDDQELIVFVDARDDHHYQEGHIPGAFQFDRYYPERYLPTVLMACLSAVKTVVYCTGGNCEDSEFAALMLKDAGVPPERLFVYPGGITEWIAAKRPVEIGTRKSGNLLLDKP